MRNDFRRAGMALVAVVASAAAIAGCGGAGSVLSREHVTGGGTGGAAMGRPDGGGSGGRGDSASSGGMAGTAAPVDAGAGGTAPGTDGGKTPPAPTEGPLHVVFVYTPLGTVLDSWRPQMSAGGALALSPILAPLEAFKSRLLVVDGITNQLAAGQPASTHESAPSLLLTGRAGKTPGTAGGPSLDQHLGSVAFSSTPFRSLPLGVQTGASAWLGIGYGEDGQPVPAENQPANVNQRLFGNALGASIPPVPAGDPLANDNFPLAGRAQIDQLVAALAYDLVGTASLSWGDVDGRTTFSWLGPQLGDLRYLADHSGTAGAARDQFVAAQTWFAQQLAALLGALRDTTLGAGNRLDDTIVVWLSETGEASTQTGRNIPVVIVAPPGRGLRTGALIAPVMRSQGDLMSTIARVVGGAAALPSIPGASPISDLLTGP